MHEGLAASAGVGGKFFMESSPTSSAAQAVCPSALHLQALQCFVKGMKGADGCLIAPESRTGKEGEGPQQQEGTPNPGSNQASMRRPEDQKLTRVS